jgi:anti-sigma B factor antagonist
MSDNNKFGIRHQNQEGIDCLYLAGYLDAHTAPDLETELGNLVENGKNKIVVNFRDLDYISSAGLGVFMAFIEDVRECGGDIKLSDMKPKVFSVFDLLGFPILFDIEDKEQEAFTKFKNNDVKSDEE